ncbi:hypothetical protein EUTSA_v10015401mg [Eutrema salsugineum]|uniref:Uncharacterized protein n=1 Tax=Eutrema salsugineum TaxID=72664 RepID=V4LN46_EUTSA|nr:hypothetical protein EUTSA_v10015401mg [Eutrema salsugineum]
MVLLYATNYKDVQTVVNILGRKFEIRVTEESLMDRLTTNTHEACLSFHANCSVRICQIHKESHILCLIDGADHEFTSHHHQLASIVFLFFKLDPKKADDSGDISTSN